MSDSVFVMMPSGEPFSTIYREVIEPAVTGHGLVAKLEEQQVEWGPIAPRIVERIKQSQFCIADLPNANPNVMYEVAIAHMAGKQVILLTQGDPAAIPFDVRHHRAIPYQADSHGHTELASVLGRAVAAAHESQQLEAALLQEMLAPPSIDDPAARFAVVASPLSYRAAHRTREGWQKRFTTLSDHVGIRGLMQAFGLIYGLDRLPELASPDDFDDEVLEQPATRTNLYTIGSPKANRWTGVLMSKFFERRYPKWEFRADPESPKIWNPLVMICMTPHPGEPSKEYKPAVAGERDRTKWDFGLVIRGPHPMDEAKMFMVLAGRSSLGTEAACLAATDPACLRRLKEHLRPAGVSLRNHREAFCAVVCISSKSDYTTDRASFNVCQVSRCI